MAFKMLQVEDHMPFNVTRIISKAHLNEVLSPLKRATLSLLKGLIEPTSIYCNFSSDQ